MTVHPAVCQNLAALKNSPGGFTHSHTHAEMGRLADTFVPRL